MPNEVTALYDKGTSGATLYWGRTAVAEGTFSEEQGQIYVGSEEATVSLWTTTSVEFTPVVGANSDGTHSVHFDNVLGEYFHEFTTCALGGFSVDRASIATAMDDQGILQDIPANTPVYEGGSWSGSAWTDVGTTSGLRIEPESTNLCLNSDMALLTGNYGCTATKNAVDSKGRANGAWTLTDGSGDYGRGATNDDIFCDYSSHSIISFRVKKVRGAQPTVFPALGLNDYNSLTGFFLEYNPWEHSGVTVCRTAHVYDTDIFAHGSIDEGDWWRIWCCVMSGNNSIFVAHYPAYNDGLGQPQDDVTLTNTIVVCDLQLEVMGVNTPRPYFPTSFIETSGATVTRAQQIVSAHVDSMDGIGPFGADPQFNMNMQIILRMRTSWRNMGGGGDEEFFTMQNGSGSDTGQYLYLRSEDTGELKFQIRNQLGGNTLRIMAQDLHDKREHDLVDIRLRIEHTGVNNDCNFTSWIDGVKEQWTGNIGDFSPEPLQYIFFGKNSSLGQPSFWGADIVALRMSNDPGTEVVVEAWDEYKEEEYIEFNFFQGNISQRFRDMNIHLDAPSVRRVFASDGLLKTVAAGEPAFPWADYDGSDFTGNGNATGILFEGSQTNYYSQSNMSNWQDVGTIGILDAVDSAGRANGAVTVTDNDGANRLEISYWAPTMDLNDYICQSVRFKKAAAPEGKVAGYRADWGSGSRQIMKIDLFTGEYTYADQNELGLANCGVIDEGNWWRVYIHGECLRGDPFTNIYPAMAFDMTPGIVDVDATGTCIVCDAQIENDAHAPTSFIETTGATATRTDVESHSFFKDLVMEFPKRKWGTSGSLAMQTVGLHMQHHSEQEAQTYYYATFTGNAETSASGSASSTYIYHSTRNDMTLQSMQNVQGGNKFDRIAPASPILRGDIVDMRSRYFSARAEDSGTGGTVEVWFNQAEKQETTGTLDGHRKTFDCIKYMGANSGTVPLEASYVVMYVKLSMRALTPEKVLAWPTWDKIGVENSTYSYDFASKADLGAATYSRASTATCLDNSWAPIALADDDYGVLHGSYSAGWLSTINSRGIQVEPDKTNLCKQSEDMGGAGWTDRGTISMLANDALDPLGSNTACLIELGKQPDHDIYMLGSGVVNVGDLIGYAVWMRQVTATGVIRAQNAHQSTSGQWNIDLSLLSKSWERITREHPAVTIVAEMESDGNGNFGMHFRSSDDGVYQVEMWGHHWNVGRYVGSYIPTAGSTVTRATAPCFLPLPAMPSMPSSISGSYAFQLIFTLPSGDLWNEASGNIVFVHSGEQSYLNVFTRAPTIKSIRIQLTIDSNLYQFTDLDLSSYSPGDVIDFRYVHREGVEAKYYVDGVWQTEALTHSTVHPITEFHFGEHGWVSTTNPKEILYFNLEIGEVDDATIEGWAGKSTPPLPALPPAPPEIGEGYTNTFATTKQLNGFSFSRPSIATAVDETRVLVHYLADQPAWNEGYGVMIEGASTNEAAYADFSNAYWAKNEITVATGLPSPDGATDAYRLSSSGASEHLNKTSILASGDWMSMYHYGDGTTSKWANLGYHYSVDASKAGLARDQWNRQKIEAVAHGGTYTTHFYIVDYRGGDTDVGIFYGPQWEAGTHCTSYVPTAGSSATRADAELWAMLSNLEGVSNTLSTDFTLHMVFRYHMDMAASRGELIFQLMNSDGSDYYELQLFNGGDWYTRSVNSAGTAATRWDETLAPAGAPKEMDVIDIRLRKSSTRGITMWIDGVLQGHSITAASMASFNALDRIGLGYDIKNDSNHNDLDVIHIGIIEGDIDDATVEAFDSPYLRAPSTTYTVGVTTWGSQDGFSRGSYGTLTPDDVYWEQIVGNPGTGFFLLWATSATAEYNTFRWVTIKGESRMAMWDNGYGSWVVWSNPIFQETFHALAGQNVDVRVGDIQTPPNNSQLIRLIIGDSFASYGWVDGSYGSVNFSDNGDAASHELGWIKASGTEELSIGSTTAGHDNSTRKLTYNDTAEVILTWDGFSEWVATSAEGGAAFRNYLIANDNDAVTLMLGPIES